MKQSRTVVFASDFILLLLMEIYIDCPLNDEVRQTTGQPHLSAIV